MINSHLLYQLSYWGIEAAYTKSIKIIRQPDLSIAGFSGDRHDLWFEKVLALLENNLEKVVRQIQSR